MAYKIKIWFLELVAKIKEKWESEKEYFEKTLNSKELKKIVAVLVSCGMVLTAIVNSVAFEMTGLVCEMVDITREQKEGFKIVENWYIQLPEEHWIKANYGYAELNTLYTACTGTSKATNKILVASVSQIENVGEFIGRGMEYIDSKKHELYELKYEGNEKNLKEIKVKVGETRLLQFSYDNIPYLFDFTMEELAQNISTRIVYCYVEDTTIAVIRNGEVRGVKKGKTTLHLFANGYLFECPIKVK